MKNDLDPIDSAARYRNHLEPTALIEHFIRNEPEGFTVNPIQTHPPTPAFYVPFDLGTTFIGIVKRIWSVISPLIPRPRTLFVGTTVSEYALFPKNINARELVNSVVSEFRRLSLPLLIVKDIPLDSPLLSAEENNFSTELIKAFEENNFIVLSGEALAYMPIGFASLDAYLQTLSKSRRKDLKRKLRSRNDLTIKEFSSGDSIFTDAFISQLYDLYLEVYNASHIHFDKLSLKFFSAVFRDKTLNGIIFLYYAKDQLIGFNLSFLSHGRLVDKYIGMSYPLCREHNLYFVSWFHNIEYCITHGIKCFVSGWTDPEIKAYLGSSFTSTYHAVQFKNLWLQKLAKFFKPLFESDKKILEKLELKNKAKGGE